MRASKRAKVKLMRLPAFERIQEPCPEGASFDALVRNPGRRECAANQACFPFHCPKDPILTLQSYTPMPKYYHVRYGRMQRWMGEAKVCDSKNDRPREETPPWAHYLQTHTHFRLVADQRRHTTQHRFDNQPGLREFATFFDEVC